MNLFGYFFCLTLLMSLTLLGCISPTTSDRSEPPSPTIQSAQISKGGKVRTDPRKFTKGEVLYLRHCADCHGWRGAGNGPAAEITGNPAPALNKSDLQIKYSDEDLVDWVLFGRLLSKPSESSYGVDGSKEATALLNYIRRLPTISWDRVNAGQEVYDDLCVGCHGIYGRGDGDWAVHLTVAPRDLTDAIYRKELNEKALYKIIEEGKGAMPATTGVLSRKDIENVIAFVRILSTGFEYYDRSCALCHGPDGVPIELALLDESGREFGHSNIPVFNSEYFLNRSEDQIRTGIRHMRDEHWLNMPHFAGELRKEQIMEILGYLGTLNQNPR